MILHGNRAVNFAYGTHVPIIGVTHSYSTQYIVK